MTGPVYSQEIRDKAVALYRDGAAVSDIARRYGCNETSVRRWIRDDRDGVRRQLERGPRMIDHTGVRYGEMVVKRFLGKTSHYGAKKLSNETQPLWEVECDCGETILRTSAVINLWRRRLEKEPGWKPNCGDHPSHVAPCRIGDRAGFLEAIDFPENTGQCGPASQDRWVVACICHACNERSEASPYFITFGEWRARVRKKHRGWTSACGCLRGPITHGLKTRYSSTSRSERSVKYDMWKSASRRAKKKGVPFEITPEDVHAMEIPEFCPVLGVPIVLPVWGSGRTGNAPSLDRTEPHLGYVRGNVEIVSDIANIKKNSLSLEESEMITAYLRKKRSEVDAKQRVSRG